MNKKRLSVVMAGAMLASSVAPVLAAEVTNEEVSANELGLLQKELRELINSKVFANEKINGAFKNHSVYKIYVNGNPALGLPVAGHPDGLPLDVNSTQEDWQHVFNTLNEGDKVEVYSKGFREADGKYYHFEQKTGVLETYTQTEIENLASTFYNRSGQMKGQYKNLIDSAEYDDVLNEFVIKFDPDTKVPGLDEQDTLRLSEGSTKLKYEKATFADKNEWDTYFYLDSEGEEHALTDLNADSLKAEDFYGFAKTERLVGDGQIAIKPSKVRSITITAGGYNFNVTDLYDGLMLTEKGHDFLSEMKDAISMGRTVTVRVDDKDGFFTVNHNIKVDEESNSPDLKGIESTIDRLIKEYKGAYKFTVTFSAVSGSGIEQRDEEVYTIKGSNKANTVRLATWLASGRARVDILAGDNRYETAVEIAKEYARINGPSASNGEQKTYSEIILVNGNALVDGLAAAPLAETLGAKSGNISGKAPILLTEAGSLPKATKAYLKELMADHLVGGNKTATIHLVGGESVLNKSLERELRGLGFKVERHGGDNREETSLAVAEAMGANFEGGKNAFVVGAEGEADAMSIASVAAATKTPIIVAKKGGISEDALYELKGSKTTVIGGESAVSASDYKALRSVVSGLDRVHGSNRQATNAEIIKKYYKSQYVGMAKNVIVAKDGQRNKMELVDALAAANFAAEKKAPIVLATSKVSKAQENALELNAKKSFALYQVGHGVSRDVVKTIAQNLGLTNR